MDKSNTIISKNVGPVGTLTMNRPEVHNALNMEMIRNLTNSIKNFESHDIIRIVILKSSGKHFSAGADLNWMKDGLAQEPQQLESESLELADLFRIIHDSNLIFLSLVQGKVIGGANGLIAASDIVVAEKGSSFAFSEAQLGLVPATIAPYVMQKLGYSRTKELMLTGRTFGTDEAITFGLVNHHCEVGDLELTSEKIINELLANGPEALIGIKQMLSWLTTNPSRKEVRTQTASTIARFRISPEGQEGLNAFFEKRKPYWDETV